MSGHTHIPETSEYIRAMRLAHSLHLIHKEFVYAMNDAFPQAWTHWRSILVDSPRHAFDGVKR